MNTFIALQTILDAIEKLHAQPLCTKQEIIRNEQALQALQTLVNKSNVTERIEPTRESA